MGGAAGANPKVSRVRLGSRCVVGEEAGHGTRGDALDGGAQRRRECVLEGLTLVVDGVAVAVGDEQFLGGCELGAQHAHREVIIEEGAGAL